MFNIFSECSPGLQLHVSRNMGITKFTTLVVLSVLSGAPKHFIFCILLY